MTKKPITQISSEDLLKLLEDNKDIKDENHIIYKNDIVDFISKFNLKQGQEKVSTRILYIIYTVWSKNKVNKRTFSTHLGSFFECKPSPGNKELMVLLDLTSNELLRKTIIKKKRKFKHNPKFLKEHFENYLSKYDIKKGSFFVKSSILYNLYDKWVYSFRKQRPLKTTQFDQFFKIFTFAIKSIDNENWFGIDKSIIKHLTEENINQMRTNVKKTN